MERHDDSPDLVNRDRAESVSDASQYATDGGAVCSQISQLSNLFSAPDCSSSPSECYRSVTKTTVLPQTPAPASPIVRTASSQIQTLDSEQVANLSVTDTTTRTYPSSLPNGLFKCPKCPRVFRTLQKARDHMRPHVHRCHCRIASCDWSFPQSKDLLRHERRHNTHLQKYTCPVETCPSHQSRSRNSFSRKDLLSRHMRNKHPG